MVVVTHMLAELHRVDSVLELRRSLGAARRGAGGGMNLHRLLTVAAMHGRDLSRRRLALIIVTLLPLAFFFFYELQPADPATAGVAQRSVLPRTCGLWPPAPSASAGPSPSPRYSLIGSRRADQSLLFAGYRPTELLMGRVLTVLGLAAVIAPLSAVVIWSQRDLQFVPLLASIGLSALVAAAMACWPQHSCHGRWRASFSSSASSAFR